MTHLLSATHEPDREPTDSRAILLLDFRKAYDTVSRDFLFEVMRYFGFADTFITLIRNLHHDTTARFVVNGTLSDPIPDHPTGLPVSATTVSSRGGNTSNRTIAKYPDPGLRHPGLPTQELQFSAFVDDSTVFFTPRGTNSGGTGHRASFWEILRSIDATSKEPTDLLHYSGLYIQF